MSILSNSTTQKQWSTQIRAIDPADGQLKSWSGPTIFADTMIDAQIYCLQNGLGYCIVVGELTDQIPFVLAEVASMVMVEN